MSHTKKQIQLDRIILFTDAVFAIAITLLAIEIRIPELHERTEESAIQAFLLIVPRLFGFFISFFVIGIYWISHHKIFSYVVNYDRKLLWKNLLLLMFVVLMPFTTGFFFEFSFLKFPFLLYSINILILGIFQARLLNYIVMHKFSEGLQINLKKYIIYRGLTPGLVFMFLALIQYLLPDNLVGWSRMLMMLTAIVFPLLKKHFAKKGVDVINY